MSASVQLILPGLFDLPLQELEPRLLQQGLAQLNRILRLATARPNQAFTIDAILRDALSGEDSVQTVSTGLPMAPAFAAGEATEPERLLLCQAIHLRADMHSAVIEPIELNPENTQDIDILINDLEDLFNVDCNIKKITDGRFLLQLKQFDAPTYYPHILSVLGKTANPYIEQSRRNLPWYKLLNEVQMFLHQHDVNQQRIQRGLVAINSLWFWGAGHRLQLPDASLSWYCDDPGLNRFAEHLGLVPDSCAAIAAIPEPGDALVVDLRLLEMLKTQRTGQLDQLLLDIDQQLFRPLLSMVQKRRSQLVLRAGYEFDFVLQPSALMKFWRRQRYLSHWTIGEGEL